MRYIAGFIVAVLSALPCIAQAAVGHAEVGQRLDGAAMHLGLVVPFAGLLLSIAILPLVIPGLWHRHFGKITAAWALLGILPIAQNFGIAVAVHELLHVALLDYIPFIVLLTTLYTVTGGIRVTGRIVGTPEANTATLGIGTLLAGFMGTTGASMLLVRPILTANARRQYKVHVFIFLIFLVSNVGGALSPLGDPPLFLGFLRGIEFFWPTIHLLLPTTLIATILLLVFYALDRSLYQRERSAGFHLEPPCNGGEGRLRIEGSLNAWILLAVLLAVLASGKIDLLGVMPLAGFDLDLDGVLRDVVLLTLTALSLRTTSADVRTSNNFAWGPMAEVALLFAGIFVTIIAPLAILRAGHGGALGGVMAHLMDEGKPVDAVFFWATGALSSFLDNAPTYLVFFNAAGGDPQELMGPLASTLAAISAGAVYMGAITYIGNAPNLMVKSMVEAQGVRMPSFFGYMLWSMGSSSAPNPCRPGR
jgi:Na+/H+ antiporter NhaD/arsenite permease-like protein